MTNNVLFRSPSRAESLQRPFLLRTRVNARCILPFPTRLDRARVPRGTFFRNYTVCRPAVPNGRSATADQSGGPQRSGPPTGAQKHHGNGTPNGGNAAPTLPPLPPLPTLPPLPAFPSLLLGGPSPAHRTPCVCGVFLSSQVAKGAAGKQPTGHAALLHEHDEWTGPCNALGTKTCTNKCLEIVSWYTTGVGAPLRVHRCAAASADFETVPYDITWRKTFAFVDSVRTRNFRADLYRRND